MAKMFYTLEEAAQKLGKSEDDVRKMATSGQIQEFRDRDKLMFKVDQIDLLAGGDDEDVDAGLDLGGSALGGSAGGDLSGMIPLADDSGLGLGTSDSRVDKGADTGPVTGMESGLGSGIGIDAGASGDMGSGSGLGLGDDSGLGVGGSGSGVGGSGSGGSGIGVDEGDSKEKTGVSIFDADELEQADPSAVTQITDEGVDDLTLDSVGSGSGLMDLTRESDDTSLGAEFLDEIYPGDDSGAGAEAQAGGGSLFEGGGEAEAGVAAAPAAAGGAVMMAEPYDGTWSGIAGGVSVGVIAAMAVGMFVVITSMMGLPEGGLTAMVTENFIPVVGGLAGLTLIAAIVGFVLGRRG